MQRHQNRGMRVRPCDWTEAPFAKLQALATDGKPIVSWKDQNQAFATVAKRIRDVVKEIRPKVVASAPGVGARPVPAGAPSPIWNVPHNRNVNFTRGEGLPIDLRKLLLSGKPTAVTGLGGMGKIKLWEYAYRHDERALKIFEQCLGRTIQTRRS